MIIIVVGNVFNGQESQGIRGTPGFLIGSDGDYELVSGAQPFEAFSRVTDAKLATVE